MEILRRIDRGSVSVTLLSRSTGLGPPHISNFLRGKRRFSIDALDRLLACQLLGIEDLLPDSRFRRGEAPGGGVPDTVPLVSHSAALFEPRIRNSSAHQLLYLPANTLGELRTRTAPSRRQWHRFVAVRVSPAQARPMEPLLQPNSVAVLDRHYNSLLPYRPPAPHLAAVRAGSSLLIRYLDYQSSRLVLRPVSPAHPVQLLEPAANETPNDLIVGRVTMLLSPL